MDLFQYDFMLRALVGALVIGLAAPALGIYLVQRRLALIGDGIGHVALTGVGAGLLLNRSPVLVAVIAATLGAIVIELVRSRGRTSGDLALALLFYGGIAGGVLLVGLSDASSASLNSYLFGSLTTTSPADLTTILVLGLAVGAIMLALRPALFAVCHDEEYARVSGLPVRALNLLLAVTTAVTVTIAMRAVGVLLISALMVVPVATAQQVTRGFRSTMAAAMALGLFAAGAGIWVAATADTAPGASVVLLAIASFLVVALAAAGWRAMRRRTRPAAAPAPEPHEVVLR
ncbi:zinc transport system permease protein [Micromonospora kangleipakensis]|uniref:Zinc transport system permease protein n=1 Tax=Micromonospora kangleipakensis TaxID=1077942 RepID=A0A4Q8BJF0_9ACTN|nr:metal ABC transporter permease [Micromonospora kangleipakensis]RZU77553.1 zinc transport system permease protein [Micromonospora kangleipakensis]